jgi:hypothetical protein
MLLHSQRVYQDLTLALEHPLEFQEHIIIRKWVNVDCSMEFRCFVSNGNLNAISQYNYQVYFPHLSTRKEEIQKRICDYFIKVHPLLESIYQSYIIDFGFCDNYEVKVIELNPFLSTTDAALFSWEKDYEQLQNGPLEFRIRTKIPVGFKTRLTDDWRRIVDSKIK